MLKQKRSVFVLSLYSNLCGVLVWNQIPLFLIFQRKNSWSYANEILIHRKIAFVFLLGGKREVA